MSLPQVRSPIPSPAPLPSSKAFHYRGVTAASPVMRRLFTILEQIERTRESVLFGGERGVGKARIARALHDAGASPDAPFVVLDAASVAGDSETDAVRVLGEILARAAGGSLLLRDVEQLSRVGQDALLHLLPLYRASVRLFATTTRSLEDEVQHGRFAEDLYDALATVRLYVPPLRHRPEDVPVLAKAFAVELGARPLAPPVLADLAARAWTGNVAELRSTVATMTAERAGRESQVVASGEGGAQLEEPYGLEEALEQIVDVSVPYAELKEHVCERFARVYLTVLIAHTRGNRTEAARIAGLDRTYLGRMLVKLGVPVPR